MTKNVEYKSILDTIRRESDSAADLFETMFSNGQDEIISFCDGFPELKPREEIHAKLSTSLMASYMTGLTLGMCVRKPYRKEVDNDLIVISRNLGLKIA